MTKAETVINRRTFSPKEKGADCAENQKDDSKNKVTKQQPKSRRRSAEPDIFYEIIGGLVRAQRTAKGLSLNMLSALSGVAYETVWSIENGRANATLDTMRRIAKVLDCSLRDLLPDSDVHDPIRVNIIVERRK